MSSKRELRRELEEANAALVRTKADLYQTATSLREVSDLFQRTRDELAGYKSRAAIPWWGGPS